MCWNVSWPASADSLVKTPDLLFRWNFTPVTVVHHCIRRQCFVLLPNVWVVFKIYFVILHNIVTRNNVQQRIRLNKQKKKVTHICITSGYLCYTSRSFALSTWPHGRDVETCKRWVAIFLKTVKGVMFDINLMFIGYLVKHYSYIWVYLYWYMLSLLKVSECKHTQWVFVMLSIWSLFRCSRKFVFTEFLTTWLSVKL